MTWILVVGLYIKQVYTVLLLKWLWVSHSIPLNLHVMLLFNYFVMIMLLVAFFNESDQIIIPWDRDKKLNGLRLG